MDSVLRPRDIQARIRSGESPEAVAAAAQTSLDRIMGYATPVLAERAYVAEQALKASVRRRAGDGPVGHLGAAAEQRLAARDVDPAGIEWDAWRREDGRWTLVADYPADHGTARAQFVYDMAGRYVTAENDDARWLVGERSSTQQPATGQATPTTVDDESVVETVFEPAGTDETTAPVPRLDPEQAGERASEQASEQVASAAPVEEHDPEQLPLGDDAIGVVTGRQSTPRPPTADEWMSTQATERAAPRRVQEEPAETLFDAPEAEQPSPEPEPVVEDEQPQEAAPAADERPKQRKSGKPKRASVPSWDEIMFGSGKGE